MIHGIKKFAEKLILNWLMKKINKGETDEKKSDTLIEVKTSIKVVQVEHTKTIKGG